MHIKKLTSGGWLGRARISNYSCIVDGDTLQECIDKMFEMMMKEEANGTL